MGYVATAKLLPLIAFLPLGGVVADRLPRHKVMAAANVLQALAQGASATLVLTGHARIWELAALAARANALDQMGQDAACSGRWWRTRA